MRLDAHTVYGPQYVAAIEQALSSLPGEVWCVGGAPVPGEEPRFGEALHAALFTNPMGLGPAPFRSSADVREVEHVYLGGWRPGVLQRLGGWDERWRANEDCELSARLRAAGGRIVRIPLESRVLITRGPLGAVRQWARYGYWRARTIREHPEVMRGRHLIPPVALLGAAVAAATPLRVALLPAAGLYAAGVIAGRRRKEAALVTLASPGFFAAVHVAYALGLLAGAAAMERGTYPDAGGSAFGAAGPVRPTDPLSPKQLQSDVPAIWTVCEYVLAQRRQRVRAVRIHIDDGGARARSNAVAVARGELARVDAGAGG